MDVPGSFARRLGGDGPTVFGTWVKLPTIETVELLGHAGFDFIVVDMEHAPLTLESAYRAIVWRRRWEWARWCAYPDRSDSHLQRLLDSGADGILVPRVTDAATCRASVDAMRFSPTGVRGLGSTSRAGRWGLDTSANYLDHGSDGIVRGVQVEDQGGLASDRRDPGRRRFERACSSARVTCRCRAGFLPLTPTTTR